MIVYFHKKSKKIIEWGSITLWTLTLVYSLYVWTKFVQNDNTTIQILIKNNTLESNFVNNLSQNRETISTTSTSLEYMFIGSSRGKYYYPKDCSKARSLSVKNMLYFKDKIEAEAAGYIAHSGC